jgi:excisionase family DNA binding protein
VGDPVVHLDAAEARLALLALDLSRRVGRPLLSRLGVLGDVAAVAARLRGSLDGTAPGASSAASAFHPAHLCTVPVAAALLGCTPRAVVKAIHAGRVRAWRPGREWLLDVREVRRWAERRSDSDRSE